MAVSAVLRALFSQSIPVFLCAGAINLREEASFCFLVERKHLALGCPPGSLSLKCAGSPGDPVETLHLPPPAF